TTETIDLAVGGRFDYNNQDAYSYNNSLLNYRNNSAIERNEYAIWGRFTQRFKTSEDSGIKNAYYTIQADYSKRTYQEYDRNHKDDVFSYGYVGKFEETFTPNYEFRDDTLNGVFIHDAFRPIGVEFTPSEVNSDLAAVNSQLFNFVESLGGTLYSREEIRAANGLLNGDPVQSVYGIWNGLGAPSNTFQNFEQSQFRVMANGSIDLGNHAISLGVEYEQLTERSYNLAPRGLWTIGRLLTNFHISEIDYNNLIGEPELINGNYYYTFDRLVGDDQTFFDANLREKLGLPVNGTDLINFDAIDPSLLSLDMFSADELLNEGQSLVNYYGYDHTGEVLKD